MVSFVSEHLRQFRGREKLRHFFEVHRNYVCVAALSALADEGAYDRAKAARAIEKYGVDPERSSPTGR